MFKEKLIRMINQGRCFAFVGSGPSCELGYPSWKELAETLFFQLKNEKIISDDISYKKYISNKKYAELFRQAERDLGSRDELLKRLRKMLTIAKNGSGIIYGFLSKWPFAGYFTTNYDNEIQNFLNKTEVHFSVLRNTKDDFYTIRDGMSNIIFKIHSDLEHPNEVIITSEDYQKAYSGDSWTYYRDKLRQIFEIFDIFIIGYSLSDPDISYILKYAKNTASPYKPIYMVAADYTQAEENELFEKFNIELIPYSKENGNHSQLRRLLSIADKFIVPRKECFHESQLEKQDSEKVLEATSLFLFRKLQSAKSSEVISPLVLQTLENNSNAGISFSEMIKTQPLKAISPQKTELMYAVRDSLECLIQEGLVYEIKNKYFLSEAGIDNINCTSAIRKLEKDKAYGQFIIDLKKYCANFTYDEEKCKKLAEDAIITTFANRGFVIANKVFTDQSAGAEDLSDVFEYVSGLATSLDNYNLKTAFVEAMHHFLISPSEPQKQYLASISQGYFLYHLLGLDPRCTKLRKDIFSKTLWICDSSVLLPLAAIGSHNHDFAHEFFKMLRKANAVICITSKLLREVYQHYDWAVSFIKNNGVESLEMLKLVLNKGSYKQNLFIDGYIRLSALGKIGSFSDYIENIKSKNNFKLLDEIIDQGIIILDISKLQGFEQQDWGDIQKEMETIRLEREKRSTFRSELQILSEAEVLILIQNLRNSKYKISNLDVSFERFYFVSQSRILDIVSNKKAVITWTPEAVYRYLSALPDENANPDLLQQCMLNEYYYAGVSFIDKERYLKFFGPYITASKIYYEKEKSKFIDDVESNAISILDDSFDKTPDLEKQFFISQMGWKIAESAKRAEIIAKSKTKEAEMKVKQLEAEKAKKWKIRSKTIKRQEIATERHLRDPKHLKKRSRQAKKRKKKRQ